MLGTDPLVQRLPFAPTAGRVSVNPTRPRRRVSRRESDSARK